MKISVSSVSGFPMTFRPLFDIDLVSAFATKSQRLAHER